MAEYVTTFTKPYPSGYQDLPSEATPVGHEIIESWENAIVSLESYLSENNIPEVSANTTVKSGTKTATITIDGTEYIIYSPSVSYESAITGGTKVGTITVGTNTFDVYAPASSVGSTVSVVPKTLTGTNIAEITVDGTTYQLYAPTGGGSGSTVTAEATLTEGTQIGKITIDGTETILYAPTASHITVDSELSVTSANPVQNKVVKAEFDQLNSNLSILKTNLGDLKKEEVDKKIESEVATDFSQADTPQFQKTIDDVLNDVSELKDDLGEYTYTKTEGMYVNALGEILPYDGAYDIYTIDVSLFNGRTISGHTTGYANSSFGAFYKKDGSVISVVTNSGSDMPWEYSFVIPVGAEKFVIDYRTSGSGDFTLTIDNITQSFIDFAKVTKEQIETVTVGINGDYPSIIKALKSTNDRVKVRVLAGTYDLVHEFREYYGDDFFINYNGYDAHQNDHFYKGMWINNGRVIEFDSKAKVIFNYNGENDSVKSQFSVFSMGYNATIRGLNLVYSGCRYAIHDDFARLNGEYHSGTNVIENCTFDGNPYFPAVIGGGFGNDNEYIIRNCLFLNNSQNNDVTYHNTYYGNAKSKLIIENCYGNKDCKMFWYGSSELISDCIVTNSKFNSISCVAHSYEPNTNENIRLFAWNNITTN